MRPLPHCGRGVYPVRQTLAEVRGASRASKSRLPVCSTSWPDRFPMWLALLPRPGGGIRSRTSIQDFRLRASRDHLGRGSGCALRSTSELRPLAASTSLLGRNGVAIPVRSRNRPDLGRNSVSAPLRLIRSNTDHTHSSRSRAPDGPEFRATRGRPSRNALSRRAASQGGPELVAVRLGVRPRLSASQKCESCRAGGRTPLSAIFRCWASTSLDASRRATRQRPTNWKVEAGWLRGGWKTVERTPTPAQGARAPARSKRLG